LVIIKSFLLLKISTEAAASGPINIAGSAYEIHSIDVAIDEPVIVNSLVRSRKFIMFIVTWERI